MDRRKKGKILKPQRPSLTSIYDFIPDHCISLENFKILNRWPSLFEWGVKIDCLHPCIETDTEQNRGPVPASHILDRSLISPTSLVSCVTCNSLSHQKCSQCVEEVCSRRTKVPGLLSKYYFVCVSQKKRNNAYQIDLIPFICTLTYVF